MTFNMPPIPKGIWGFITHLIEFSLNSIACTDIQMKILLHESLSFINVPLSVVSHLVGQRNINIPDEHGIFPLFKAIGKQRWDIVELLLQHGADPNKQDKLKRTPLHTALSHELAPVDVIQRLISRENINLKDKNGDTPLHLIASQGRWELLTSLLEEGADVNMMNNKNATPLHNALTNKEVPIAILQSLTSNENINIPNVYGITPLLLVISNRQWELVSFMIENNADPSVPDDTGLTALHLAILNRMPSEHFCKVLTPTNISLALSDDIDFDFGGDSTLHMILRRERWDLVRSFIRTGADIDFQNCYGDTPLLTALREPKLPVDICEILISEKNINAEDCQGKNVLHIAAWVNQPLIPLLVSHGADIDKLNNLGKTPLLELISSEYHNPVNLAKCLVTSQNVNVFYTGYGTALKHAFLNECWDVIPTLVQYGACVKGILAVINPPEQHHCADRLLNICIVKIRHMIAEKSDENFARLEIPEELRSGLKLSKEAEKVVAIGKSLSIEQRIELAAMVDWTTVDQIIY